MSEIGGSPTAQDEKFDRLNAEAQKTADAFAEAKEQQREQDQAERRRNYTPEQWEAMNRAAGLTPDGGLAPSPSTPAPEQNTPQAPTENTGGK